MRKTPAMAYYQNKINTSPKSKLIEELKEAPLSETDYDFMIDIINRLSYKELAEKYQKSESRISKWKRSLFEKLLKYDLKTLKIQK